MYIIACVDDRNGLLFNKRRQSQDSKVIEKIKEITYGKNLWIDPFSKSLFPDAHISEHFLDEAKEGEFCFIENKQPDSKQVDGIYLFHWNQIYPYDTVFSISMELFHKTYEESFTGTSHDEITLEVYTKDE